MKKTKQKIQRKTNLKNKISQFKKYTIINTLKTPNNINKQQ